MSNNSSYKYIVWVGSIPNYFTDYQKAENYFLDWCHEGYDDIELTRIDAYKMERDILGNLFFQETKETTLDRAIGSEVVDA
jgi:hypothetical protein